MYKGIGPHTIAYMLIALPPPQLLEISGADALAFAQAQFSSDVTALETGCWQWSAWLNAQGRVRAFFHLLRIGDDKLWLLLRGGDAQRLRDALARYVLRAKVALQLVDTMRAYSVQDDATIPGAALAPDTDMIMLLGDGRLCLALPRKRWLLLAPTELALHVDDSDNALNLAQLADIDAGFAWLDPALEEKLLPQWLGLDALGATSVRKGCYPGQEIIARLHFKGGVKRGLFRLDYRTAKLLAAGAIVRIDEATGDEAGVVVGAAWREPGLATALAVLPLDKSDSAAALLIEQCRVETISRAIQNERVGSK